MHGPAEGLAGLLGLDLPDLRTEGLPLLWHWVYLLDRPAQVDLGEDGHAVRGVVPLPPGPGLRRMWAGGRVRSREPLRVGAEATRVSEVLHIRDVVGRSGPMTLVTVRHSIVQGGRVVVEEDQQIAYRRPATDPVPPPSSGPERTAAAPGEWEIEITPSLLARFSALTYNGHRIHYDREFTVCVEGYPGLLVHGPLQALAMAEAARRLRDGHVGPVEFTYRLVAPLFDFQGLVVSANRDDDAVVTQARDLTGRVTATGRSVPLAPQSYRNASALPEDR